ncbi:MAG: hypothetical protein JRE63_03355 [Deltaproteobacteria bacterium]|jgi:type IV pilus assembly protein PilY1|nr:hypothetical protein [Deltaproteobacteria bacterium]
MTKQVLLILGMAILSLGVVRPAVAKPDQYMGDSSIYVGVPQSVGTPNVLFVIDNSSATENRAVGAPYEPYERDPETGQQTEKLRVYDDPSISGGPMINPWDIYRVDQQGDFSLVTLTNTTFDLENLLCKGTDPADETKQIDVIRSTLQAYGTYTGSGTKTHPSLSVTGDGSCLTNGLGNVYALGNYLRYIIQGGGDKSVNCDPPPVVLACKNEKSCGYFELTKTISVNDENNCNPALANCGSTAWREVTQPVDPETGAPIAVENWSPDGNFVDPDTKVSYWKVPDCWAQILGDSQREIVFNALKTVVGGAAGSVKVGAMVYDAGTGQKGGRVLADVADLSAGLPLESQPDGSFKILPPDCVTSGLGTPFCRFFSVIPGPDRNGDGDYNDSLSANPNFNLDFPYGVDGYPMLPSQTARPQAEALFDAGYYFKAFLDSQHIFSGATRVPAAVENVCKLNHIILITNGLSNTDTDPLLASVVGNADGDNYPDENVYGLGSHWLDDVAKYLNNYHDITTHTILAFQSDDPLVRNAAKDGGGKYYNVNSAEELSRRLTELLANIVNERDTSFVAPVVPASTTNRTVSSNRVYLGLFKPKEQEHWHGNVKKYGFDISNNRLTEPPVDGSGAAFGDPATDPYGNFDPDSVSYWSNQNGTIITSEGTLDPGSSDPNAVKGDGGVVDAGGLGGLLLKRAQLNSDAFINGGTPDLRTIFTFLPGSLGGWSKEMLVPTNPSISMNVLGLPPANPSDLSWWSAGGYPTGTDEQRRQNLIRYLHGFDALNVDGAGESIYDSRDWVLADVLHSRPVVFNYTYYTDAEENLCSPDINDPEGKHNSSVVFVGTNDGMLHAFSDCDGRELWAYVPDNVLPNLKYLPELEHTSYVDSPPAIYFHDVDNDGEVDPGDGDRVVLIFGQRRGGGKNVLDSTARGAYYALNVTNPTNPELLWKFTVDEANAGQLAETWALPSIHPIKVPDTNDDVRIVAFIPAGYDNNEDLRYGSTQTYPDSTSGSTDINQAPSGGTIDGAGGGLTSPGTDPDGFAMRGKGLLAIEVAYLFRADAASSFTAQISPAERSSIGQVYWSYSPTDMKYSFVSDIRSLDLNRNGGFIDKLYVGDTGGNMWRIDTTDRNKDNWSGQIIFSSNSTYATPFTGYIDGTADNNVGRKIFYPPSVAVEGSMPWVCFATGDREHPLNLSVTDRLYCVKDFGQTTADAIDELDLVDVTENELQTSGTTGAEIDTIIAKLNSSPGNPVDINGNPDPGGDVYYGWYIRLDGKDRDFAGDPGEKALAEAVIFEGEVFYSTYQLKTGARAGCEAGNLGHSRLYRVDLKTGEAVFNYDLANDSEDTTTNTRAQLGDSEVLRRSDRVYNLGEGIPSGVVQVVDKSGKVGLLISSSDKVEGIGGANPAVTFPLYWIQW